MRNWINKGYEIHTHTCKETTVEKELIIYQTLILFNNKIIDTKHTEQYPEDYIIEGVIKNHWRNEKIKELGL
jgi:hypothetical protein